MDNNNNNNNNNANYLHPLSEMDDNDIHNAERRLPPHGGKTRKRKRNPTTWSKEIKKETKQWN